MRKYRIFLIITILLSFFIEHQTYSDDINSIRPPSIKHFLYDWEKIKPQKWLNFYNWKYEMKRKEDDLFYELKKIYLQHQEIIGRSIACVGNCRLYRGQKFSALKEFNEIREGDEVTTFSDSYLWIFLMDGTLIRMAPNSSISLNEINIGVDKIFIYGRINKGLVHWLARDLSTIPLSNLPETDPLFLPIRPFEANIIPVPKKVSFSTENFLEKNKDRENHLRVINKIIAENNKFHGNKPSEHLISLPNGDISGKTLKLSLFVNLGHESYFKIYPVKGDDDSFKLANEEILFTPRKYKKSDDYPLKKGIWYRINDVGLKLETNEKGDELFSKSEFFIKRPYTIYHARELFLKKYSKIFYQEDALFENLLFQGYYLWDYEDISIEFLNIYNLSKRIEFLKHKINQMEMSNIQSVKYLVNKQKISSSPYGRDFYELAFGKYLEYIANNYKISSKNGPRHQRYIDKSLEKMNDK